MKHRIFSLGSAVFALAFACAPFALATDGSPDVRSNSEDAFMQLTLNSQKALKSALKTREKALGDGSAKFKIAGVPDPTVEENDETSQDEPEEMENAAKIWFELADGTKVNPLKHQWQAKEKFYIYVEAAAPVYIWLFHETPDKNGKVAQSVQIYPDKQYPKSVNAVQPGRKTALPVEFEMDDDDQDEIMSMFVVRADWEGIQDGLTKPAVDSVSADANGRPVVNAKVDESAYGTLKCLNARVAFEKELDVKSVKKLVRDASDKEAKAIADNVNALGSAKFHVAGPLVDESESDEAEDVCFYLFSAQKVGCWRLKIQK